MYAAFGGETGLVGKWQFRGDFRDKVLVQEVRIHSLLLVPLVYNQKKQKKRAVCQGERSSLTNCS